MNEGNHERLKRMSENVGFILLARLAMVFGVPLLGALSTWLVVELGALRSDIAAVKNEQSRRTEIFTRLNERAGDLGKRIDRLEEWRNSLERRP